MLSEGFWLSNEVPNDSGALYPVVPSLELVNIYVYISSLANPKSITFKTPFYRIIIFFADKSLWAIPFLSWRN